MDRWQEAKVVKVINQTDDFRTIILKPTKYYPFKSGNFIELAVKKNGPHKEYSVVSSPAEEGTYEVGVKLFKTGELSPLLFKLKEGDNLLMRGPTGVYFIWNHTKNNTVMLAGGAGICPMISIIRQKSEDDGRMSLLFTTKQGNFYYKDEILKLCKERDIDFTLIETGKDKRLDKKSLIEKYGSYINGGTDFFAAGPSTFVQDVSLWLYEAGINPNNLKTDDFGA